MIYDCDWFVNALKNLEEKFKEMIIIITFPL